MTQLSPAPTAAIDQRRATLRDLVADVRRHHHVEDCQHPDACPGLSALAVVLGASCAERDHLLALAICELAQHPEEPTP